MMTRRSVLASLGAFLALPGAGRAQTTAGMRRIVWFGLGQPDAPSPYLDALRSELRTGLERRLQLDDQPLQLDARTR